MMGWARSLSIERKPFAYWPCFMSHLGDYEVVSRIMGLGEGKHTSGQKKIPTPRTKDGMKADPSCNLHAMSPVSLTMTLAQNTRKIPMTTHSCQNMTRAPRIRAGAISAL